MIRRMQDGSTCTPCMLNGKHDVPAIGHMNRECYWFVCERHFISASAVGGFNPKRFDGSRLTPFEAVLISKGIANGKTTY